MVIVDSAVVDDSNTTLRTPFVSDNDSKNPWILMGSCGFVKYFDRLIRNPLSVSACHIANKINK